MISRIQYKTRRIFDYSVIHLRIFVYNCFSRKKQKNNLPKKILKAFILPYQSTYNAFQERTVEITPEDLDITNLIVTCYFTLKPDPQSGNSRNSADFKNIEPWYNSVLKIGIKGIVLHDGLDIDFISRYSNDCIQFRFCKLGNYSIFEERWLLYNILLAKLPNLKKVFFTDGNDVFITRNPFKIIDNNTTLYVGRDNANRIKDSRWLEIECDKFIEESNYNLPKSYSYQWVYNAGIIGGNRNLIYFVVCEMSKLIFRTQSSNHKDMTILNIVIHENFFPKLSLKNWHYKTVDKDTDIDANHSHLVTGYPFNSGFKDFDLNSNAIFIHK